MYFLSNGMVLLIVKKMLETGSKNNHSRVPYTYCTASVNMQKQVRNIIAACENGMFISG